MATHSKHQNIEEYFISRIQSGEFPVGSQILTEVQICDQFGVSRQTVNKALQNLARDGYIERTRGRGSFVTSPNVRKYMRQHSSFTKDLESVGIVPGSKLLKYDYLSAKDVPAIAKQLRLNEDDHLHYFIRLRTGDGKPFAISYTYLSSRIIPDLDISVLNKSLNEYLQQINVTPTTAIYQLSAVMPTEAQMKVLNVDERVPLLKNQHLTFEQNGQPYEFIETFYIGTKFTYNIELELADTKN